MALELELATYRKNLPALLQQEGKFVLIRQDQVIGVFATQEDALAAGYDRFGLDAPFFIRQIKAVEAPLVFTRSVRSCPPSTAR